MAASLILRCPFAVGVGVSLKSSIMGASLVVSVPEVVFNKALAVGARGWLDELPELVIRLEKEWSIIVGRPYGDATEAYVAEAILDDGTPAVLKLIIPRDGNPAQNEITALRLIDGKGCVRLLRHDSERSALLLERLGRPMSELGLPLDERLSILSSLGAQLWRRAPDEQLPTGADKGRYLVDYIVRAWEELDRPCSERAIDDALRCAALRIEAHDDSRAVLVHGDIHQWNALESSDGFKLVDPDGLLAEAECDMGVLMREDPVELLAGDPWTRARSLAEITGLDTAAIWEWGVVERVYTGLLCTAVDLQPVGREMLTAADWIARG